jgi:hypothetical protein
MDGGAGDNVEHGDGNDTCSSGGSGSDGGSSHDCGSDG